MAQSNQIIPERLRSKRRKVRRICLLWSQLSIPKFSAFAGQQGAFPGQPATETAKFSLGRKDAMTRDEHRQGVGTAGAANGPDGLRITDGLRDFAVTFRFATGNFSHNGPDA